MITLGAIALSRSPDPVGAPQAGTMMHVDKAKIMIANKAQRVLAPRLKMPLVGNGVTKARLRTLKNTKAFSPTF